MQKTKQTIYKEHFFLIGLLFLCLILIPTVSAETDYTFWTDHKFSLTTSQVIDGNPGEISNFYVNQTITFPTYQTACSAAGQNYANGLYAVFTHAPVATNDGISDHYGPNLGGTNYPETFAVMESAIDEIWKEPAHTKVDQNRQWFQDGWAYQATFQCNQSFIHGSPLYVYHNTLPPIDYNYPNLTITAISSSSGMAIPRADITVQVTPTSTLSGKTNLNGEIFFGMVASISINSNKTITASKVGYNTSVSYVNLTENTEISVYLDDIVWNGPDNNAVVYLDVVDETTKESISGATVGINNLTSSLNSWSYNLYPESTIAFTTDGYGHNLSIGQTIQFAGYKTGYYSAGHTEEFTILSPTSKAILYLSKSNEVNITSNLTTKYYYPVSVVDAITGNNIASSFLNVSLFDANNIQETNWYNSTSSTGKFTINGYGSSGNIPIQTGDVINIYADANGYESDGWGLIASQSNNGITQMRPLMPTGITPISGEFNAQVLVFDNDNMKPLGGVVLKVSGLGDDVTQVSNNGGASVFKNLTAGVTYSIQASAYGYTTTSQTFSGESGETSYVDFFLSKSSMNPVYTVPITPEPTYTPIITYPVVTPSSWSNESAVSCIEVPKNATFIQFMKIKLACNGFDTAMSQSLAIAGIIIMLFVAIGAQYGKGNGAVIGGVIGFVLAFAAGLIPFSVLALIITMLVLVAIIAISRK